MDVRAAAIKLAMLAVEAKRGSMLGALPYDDAETAFVDSVRKAFAVHAGNPRLAIVEACNLIATWSGAE